MKIYFLCISKHHKCNKMKKWLYGPYLAVVWQPGARGCRLQTGLGSIRHLLPSLCHPRRHHPGSQSRASPGNLRTSGLQWLDSAASWGLDHGSGSELLLPRGHPGTSQSLGIHADIPRPTLKSNYWEVGAGNKKYEQQHSQKVKKTDFYIEVSFSI